MFLELKQDTALLFKMEVLMGNFFFQAWNAESLVPSLQQLSITLGPKSTHVRFALLEHLSDLFLFGSQSSVKATVN